jgi:predicted transcriptional regulator of viral defense system
MTISFCLQNIRFSRTFCEQKPMKQYLDSYIEFLLASGRFHFTREDLHSRFGKNDVAIRHGLRRLTQNKQIHLVRNGFYIIIPPEYRNTGILPPQMFIGQFMHHQERPYYVGLLSAAALHGAGHQQPQLFSVITEKPPIRPIELKQLKIRFTVRSHMPQTGVEEKKTPAGYINISSPELTALDLITYLKQSGGIAAVTSVIEELAESMAPEKLKEAVQQAVPAATLQRLGYLLENVLDEKDLAEALVPRLQSGNVFHIPLSPAESKSGCSINKKWKIYINIDLEAEL